MTHEEKVERIAEALRAKKGTGPVKFRKKAVSHQVPLKRGIASAEVIDISDLDELLAIDPVARTCVAEPGLTFDALVRETLKHGLVPMTVPELKTITVGGAVAGCSVESMSFERGGFHDSCLEYEVLTSRGEVLHCRPDNEHALVFGMVHGAFGTLGLITKLSFRLVPAKPHVHLVFERHETREAFLSAMDAHISAHDADFIDAIIAGPRNHVLCLGHFVDEAPYIHSYAWMRIYHRAAATLDEDYLSTYDYFFRYDADCHWISRNYGLENPLVRFLFGKFFLSSTRMLSLAALKPVPARDYSPEVVVDVFVPRARAADFLEFHDREFGHYPLWLVPYRIDEPYPWLSDAYRPREGGSLYLDIAIYGYRDGRGRNCYRLIEEKLEELGGIKTLISHNFYGKDEFWGIWNRGNYDKVKRLVDPDNAFRDLYDKTHPARAAEGRR